MRKGLVSELHLVEYDLNDVEMPRGSGFFQTGDWDVAHDTAECMLGAEIYLREKQKSPSRRGGIIQSYEVINEGDTKGRLRFNFVESSDLLDCSTDSKRWGQEQKHVWDEVVPRRSLDELSFKVTETDLDTDLWLIRQKNTNVLVRLVTSNLMKQGDPLSTEQIYGLFKLTWITKSDDPMSDSYVKSVKIPALGNILGDDYSQLTLSDVAALISSKFKDRTFRKTVKEHTGFTNLYAAYRGALKDWIEKNHLQVDQIIRRAFDIRCNKDRFELCRMVEVLPVISSKAGDRNLPAQNALTPLIFSLDPMLRFPVLNGRPGVKALLSALRAIDKPLSEQYLLVAELLDSGKFANAADLDRFVSESSKSNVATENFNSWVLTNGTHTSDSGQFDEPLVGDLQEKDEDEVRQVVISKILRYKRLHNQMTNTLRKMFPDRAQDGKRRDCLVDVILKDFDRNGNDLFIEVKSSNDLGSARMAIGQVLDYWCHIFGDIKPRHVAILLSGEPDDRIKKLTTILGIGLLWFSDSELFTSTKNLAYIANHKM